MRLNRFIAMYSGVSRRKADSLIEEGSVRVNRQIAHVGMDVTENDSVVVNGSKLLPVERKTMTVLLNKPVGYVCSKDGQGSPSVYDLLQGRMSQLNIAGRLDKDSSGLVILTNDGQLLQELTHPSYNKEKKYTVMLEKSISADDIKKLEGGVNIGDKRLSKLKITRLPLGQLEITLQEGRNRQIRRSFEAVGHKVASLHRTQLGEYELNDLKPEEFIEL